MSTFPGFPTNDFEFHFEEVGGALAGLVARDKLGKIREGILAGSRSVLAKGTGWTLRVAPHVVVRDRGGLVLLGGTSTEVILDVDPAPGANARIDVAYSLAVDVGGGESMPGVGLVTGLPGAVPAKPSIPEGATELGTLRVSAGNSSVTQATLAETSPFSTTVGGVLRVRAFADLAAWTPEDGALAYVLATSRSYMRAGNAWVRLQGNGLPYAMAAGEFTNDVAIANGANWTKKISFPAGRFTKPPVVVVSGNFVGNAFTGAPTKDEITLGIANRSGVQLTKGTGRLTWQAVQMEE